MAAQGPIPLPEDNLYQEVVKSGQFLIALKMIWECRDKSQALLWFSHLLREITLDDWLKHLADPTVQEYLTNEQLHSVIRTFSYFHRMLSNNDLRRPKLYQVELLIAQAPYFCKMLGYDTFIELSVHNPLLADFIINSTEFLPYLDYVLMRKLTIALPRHVENILDTIVKIHATNKHIGWVKNTLKYMYLAQLPQDESGLFKSPFELLNSLDKFIDLMMIINRELLLDGYFANLVMQKELELVEPPLPKSSNLDDDDNELVDDEVVLDEIAFDPLDVFTSALSNATPQNTDEKPHELKEDLLAPIVSLTPQLALTLSRLDISNASESGQFFACTLDRPKTPQFGKPNQ